MNGFQALARRELSLVVKVVKAVQAAKLRSSATYNRHSRSNINNNSINGSNIRNINGNTSRCLTTPAQRVKVVQQQPAKVNRANKKASHTTLLTRSWWTGYNANFKCMYRRATTAANQCP